MTEAERRRAEIRRERRQRPISIVALRLAELNRLFRDRYNGEVLPDDDSGRDDVEILAHHVFWCFGDQARRIGDCIAFRAPWMPSDEVQSLIATIIARPRRWRADSLGRRLGLTEEERARLKITTVGSFDVPKEKRTKRRAARKRTRDRARAADHRRAAGRKTRADYIAASLTTAKPWRAAGISRRTWERRRRRGARVASPSPSNISQYAGRHTCDTGATGCSQRTNPSAKNARASVRCRER